MENKQSHSESYRAAGVDIEAGYKAVALMKEHVARTMIPGVVSDIGGFGGLFAPDLTGIREPVLVSGTDGVGTKLKIAFLMDKHDTVGIDCVAMCVNDVACACKAPLFSRLCCGGQERARACCRNRIRRGGRLCAGRLRTDRRRNGRNAGLLRRKRV